MYSSNNGNYNNQRSNNSQTNICFPFDEISNITFANLTTCWLSSQANKIKESSYSRYYTLCKNHIIPKMGHYYLSELTLKKIENFIDSLLLRGRLDNKGGLSCKTVSDILSVVKCVFEYAQTMDINNLCKLDGIFVKKTENQIRVLDSNECDILVRFLFDNVNIYKLGVILSLFTGIRIGELCALKWEDINLSEKKIIVKKTIQRVRNIESDSRKTKIIISTPKTRNSIRHVPIPNIIIPILVMFKENPDSYILSGTKNYVEPRTMQYQFRKYIKLAGINPTNFHALRHTFATKCMEFGFDVKSLSEILGHATVNITLNRYVHPSFEKKLNEINRVSFLFVPSIKQ